MPYPRQITTIMRIGFAVFRNFRSDGKELPDQWALIAHEEFWTRHDVEVFQILKDVLPDRMHRWSVNHTTTSLRHIKTFVGIIDLGTARMDRSELKSLAQSIDPNTEDSTDHSGFNVATPHDYNWVDQLFRKVYKNNNPNDYHVSLLPTLQTQPWYPAKRASDNMKSRLPTKERLPGDKVETLPMAELLYQYPPPRCQSAP